MRFLDQGIDVPDELLWECDQGHVVFFCGAGVSVAKAHLPNFLQLADTVLNALRVTSTSQARLIRNEIEEISKRGGDGLISADRIFGALERDFLVREIEVAVSKALKPTVSVDLSAHELLLKLATTVDGETRIVTTNFDRLFEAVNPKLRCWESPLLPNLDLDEDIDGIVHLHGVVSESYDGSGKGGFVLSPSQFGRAYLSDGWATSFFQATIEKYVVVFIGYAADDPPVNYLLEALRIASNKQGKAYAFQGGEADQVRASWKRKGIHGIPYPVENGHVALWDTLQAWAERAHSPTDWYQSVIQKSKQGPLGLQSFERGQMVHLVSRLEGARLLSKAGDEIPGDWLAVFDKNLRFGKPGVENYSIGDSEYVDPLDLYGLDSDPAPEPISPEGRTKQRHIQSAAYDVLGSNESDGKSIPASIFEFTDSRSKVLPLRLKEIASWIEKVSYQAATLCWALRSPPLHPKVQFSIRAALTRSDSKSSEIIHRSWLYLFECDRTEEIDVEDAMSDLEAFVNRNGWSRTVVRRYVRLHYAFIDINTWITRLPKLPEAKSVYPFEKSIPFSVSY
jgi:hypothetical protein